MVSPPYIQSRSTLASRRAMASMARETITIRIIQASHRARIGHLARDDGSHVARSFLARWLVLQRELRGLEGLALQIPSSVGVRAAAKPPLAAPPNRVFRGPEAPNPLWEVKSRCSVRQD